MAGYRQNRIDEEVRRELGAVIRTLKDPRIAEIVSEFFKAKGERERYTQLNAELQTKARRDKKAFLSKQCREIEENNIMRKTRDLIKKLRETTETFHAKMGTIKDRNNRDHRNRRD